MHNHFAVTDIFQAIVKGDDKTKFTWPMEQNICTGACTEVSDTYRCVLFIGPLDGDVVKSVVKLLLMVL